MRVKAVYEMEKRNATSADVLMAHLGYKLGSGTGGRAVSALRQFGLLEEAGDNYKVSDLGFSLLFAEQGSREMEENLQKAALNPTLFRELVEAYAEGLPSDASLKSFLITKRGFNPDSVEEFIRIFKETISLAKVIPGEYAIPSGGEAAMPTLEMQDGSRTAGPSATSGMQVQVLNYGLSQTRRVRAEVKLIGQEFKQEDVELLIENLQLLKRSFGKEAN